ncbi:hypothetical protein LXA43DRAFT_838622, partial [Ganoderma leucocontextum]
QYLKANVLIFEQPLGKVYDALPPPRHELEETLAIVFSGPAKPTNDDFKHTPLFVRHSVVIRALQWLIRNNPLYQGVRLSGENLATYVDGEPPVCVVYKCPEPSPGIHLAVYEREEDEEECPFIVRTLSGTQLAKMTYQERLAFAVKYFESGGKALSIGHEENPE